VCAALVNHSLHPETGLISFKGKEFPAISASIDHWEIQILNNESEHVDCSKGNL
jgi:hypothetical protein